MNQILHLLCQPVCLCIFHSFASSTAESPAAGAENSNMCETAQIHARAPLQKKWFQQKPGMGPRLPSQAARLLIIAIGFESLLKQLGACVHVFKKQLCFSLPSGGFRSPVRSHSRSFSFSRS